MFCLKKGWICSTIQYTTLFFLAHLTRKGFQTSSQKSKLIKKKTRKITVKLGKWLNLFGSLTASPLVVLDRFFTCEICIKL